jgi:hypothetical protein
MSEIDDTKYKIQDIESIIMDMYDNKQVYNTNHQR